MLRKAICITTSAMLILSCNLVAFAGDNNTVKTTGAVTVTSESAIMTRSAIAEKTEIKLSIKDAVKIMQTTGTRAQTAELNKQSDKAIAAGYADSVQTIKKTLNNLDRLNAAVEAGLIPDMPKGKAISLIYDAQEAGATELNRDILRLRRDFAKQQIDSNYKADMNQIEYDTLKVYYGVLLAQDNLKTENDNLKAQEDILKNTKLQYQVGMLAKKDVLSAESALTAAKSSIQTAETKLEYAKMSFNFLLGYPVMQEVAFTDTLSVVSNPAIELDVSVKNAVANRNEIKGANFAVQIYKLMLDDVKSYPKSSASYLSRQVALLEAEKTAKDAPSQIEIDIRNKAADLEDKKVALEAAKAMQTYAKEGYRLISISYDAGMTTLAELQQAQVNVYRAGLGVSSAISNYDLAVYAFEYGQNFGVSRLPL